MVPCSLAQALTAETTCFADGLAKTSPQTAAASIPFPTVPEECGSCPDPPPEMTATLDVGWSRLKTTRVAEMRASDGEEATSPWSAIVESPSELGKKCLDDILEREMVEERESGEGTKDDGGFGNAVQ